MKRPLVSIIIPVYNVSEYLSKCLNSLITQTLENIELIVVNDASPDPQDDKICRLYAAEDPRIKYIVHHENLGLGGARNTGIMHATAECIGFVDSDDWVEKDMFEKLYTHFIATQSDICQCYFLEYKNYDNTLRKLKSYKKQKDIPNSLNVLFWNKIFKKSLFVDNDIYFPERRSLEDLATMPRLLYFVNKVTLVKEALYHYRVTRKGALTSNFDRIFHDHSEAFDIVKDFIKEQNRWESDKLFFEKRVLKSLIHDIGRLQRDTNITMKQKNNILSDHLKSSLLYLQFPEKIGQGDIHKTKRSLLNYNLNVKLKLMFNRGIISGF